MLPVPAVAQAAHGAAGWQVLRHREGLLRMKHEAEVSAHKSRPRVGTRFHTEQMTNDMAKSTIIGQLRLEKPIAELQNAQELYGFLFRHYKEREFWWEIVILMRKLAFGVIINQPKAPEAQTMLAIMCLFPYIALVYQRRPHISNYLTVMDVLGASFAGSLALSGLVMFGGYDTTLTPYEVRHPTAAMHHLQPRDPVTACQAAAGH